MPRESGGLPGWWVDQVLFSARFTLLHPSRGLPWPQAVPDLCTLLSTAGGFRETPGSSASLCEALLSLALRTAGLPGLWLRLPNSESPQALSGPLPVLGLETPSRW